MKVNLKTVSKKTLSCILALAVLLCSVTVMFSAFAETETETVEPYTVSYRSPAIPMFVGKALALEDLEVDFSEADGDTYAGDKIIWTVAEGDSARIMGGGFYAEETGITKFIAQYGELTQNVYVIVNEAGDYDFKLVDLADLSKNGTDYVADDWVVGGVGVSAVSYPDGVKTTVASANGYGTSYLKLNNSTITQHNTYGIYVTDAWSRGIYLYKSEILEDFADYTYSAGVYFPGYTDNRSDTELAATVTLITRANFNTEYTYDTYNIINSDETEGTVNIPTTALFTSNVLGVQLSPYGGVAITNLNGSNTFNTETNYWPRYQYHNVDLETINYDTANEKYVYRRTAGVDTITVKVDGSDLKVDLNNDYNLLDTTAETIHMSDFVMIGRSQKPADYIASNGGNIIAAKDDITSDSLRVQIAEKATIGSGTIGIMTTYATMYIKSVTVSANIDEMPNLTAPTFYTVKAASPAIPMFVGKVVDFADIVVEFGGELVSAEDITWTTLDGDNVITVGNAFYAAETGITKFTATYGEATQVVYVMVNEENDYDFYLVDIDFENDASDYDLSNWMYATSSTAYDIYYDGAGRYLSLTTNYRNTNNASDISARMFLTTKNSKKALRISAEYYGSMWLYNAPILKDFADYTLTSNVCVDSLWGDGYPDFSVITRAQVNFDADYAKATSDFHSVYGSGTNAKDYYHTDTTVPTIFAGQGENGADGTALTLRHRPFGGVLISANNSNSTAIQSAGGATTNAAGETVDGVTIKYNKNMNLNGSNGVGHVAYHSLSDYTKLVGSTNTNYSASNTADADYVLGTNMVYDETTSAKNTSRVRTLEYVLNGADIKYTLDGNTILDTASEHIYACTNTTYNAATNPVYSQSEVTDVYHEQFANYGTTAAGNAIGFGGFASSAYVFDLKVKLNGVSEDAMPKMSEPTFYKVTAANPVIPMTAATKLDTSSFLVELADKYVAGSSLTWDFADANDTDIKEEDGFIYAYERGAYTATVTDGETTDYVHIVVKNPDETEYVIYENDYRKSPDVVDDWKTTVMVDSVEYDYTLTDSDGKHINYVKTTSFPNATYKPNGFAPYNYIELGTAVNASKTITTYTTLDNDILADLTDYKVTAGMKMYGNKRGAVGIAGRVSNTVDGKYVVNSSTAVGFGASPSDVYWYSQKYKNDAFYFSGGAELATTDGGYTAVTNATVKDYLYSTVASRGFYHRIFEITYSDDTATYTAPNGATEQITGLEATKGTVALWSESKDVAASTYRSVPILTDIKVVLTEVDTSALEFEAIDHTPAAIPEKELYEDKANYTFGYDESGKNITYVNNNTADPSSKIVFPADIDGKEVATLGVNIYFNNSGSGNIDLTVQGIPGEVVISEGILQTYDNTFWQTEYFDTVTFPKSFTIVGPSSFRETGLIEVSFPEGSKLTEIRANGFSHNYSLVKVSLPEGLKTIGNQAFYNNKVLYDVNIPSTVETIGSQAFEAVPVKNVTLPAATTSLGDNAFSNCSYLEKIYVLNPEMTIGATAIPATATIYGYTGSTAETYAAENGNTFVPIDDIASNEIAANTAFNLAASSFTVDGVDERVSGADIAWTAHRDADYEISNGWLLVYGEEDFTITGTYGKTAVTVSIKVADKGTNTGLEVTTFADANMTIAPVADNATAYTVTINETDKVALKYGTLTVTADYCDAVKVVNATNTEATVFGFNVIKPETMVLAAEYTTLAEREASVYGLGAQVRPKTDDYTAGIRFVTRFPEITEQTGGIYLDENYTQAGVLIIPRVLWDGTTLPDAEALKEADVPMGKADKKEIPYTASNVIIQKLMTATEAYSDAAALLTGIPSSMYGTDIMALAYVIGKDNVVTYIDGDPMVKNYSEVLAASYPTYANNIDNLIYGGTDHDIDGDAATTAVSYKVGEDITFILRLKGDYTMSWSVDKDDPDVNVIEGETYTEGSTVVKKGTFDPATDGSIFTYTTQMAAAGAVRLTVNFMDANGVSATGGNIYLTALVDSEKITQSLESVAEIETLAESAGMTTAEYLVDETSNYYSTWTAAWDIQVASIDTAGAVAWLAGDSAVGDEYTSEGSLKLKVAAKTDAYTAYNFWIATGTAGLDTTVATNERPATGVFSVPNSTSDLNIYASFGAWGTTTMSTIAPQTGRLDVRILPHGKDNGASFDVSESINTTDPTQTDLYGILKRDYIAINLAKSLFADKLATDATVKTNGGSAGGWQAVTYAALDADVTEINTFITWVCQLGASDAGDITSWNPTYCDGTRVFSTVTAARVINKRVEANGTAFEINITTAGLGDYSASAPHGLMALYNAFDSENVAKSITFKQFKAHGAEVAGTYTTFLATITNK